MKKFKKLLSFIIISAMVCTLSACTFPTAGETSLRVLVDYVPTNFDPQLADSTEELMVVRNCFEGLFRIDKGEIKNAACKSFTVSGDGLKYTFKLRDGLKWSDGTALTAKDFVFGLRRALSPQTGCPDADEFYTVKNAKKVHSGSLGADSLGVSAVNDTTLQISLSRPDKSLTRKLSYAAAMPCSESVFTAGKGRYCMERPFTLTNGPFALSSMDTKSIVLRNCNEYDGSFKANMKAVTFTTEVPMQERESAVYNDTAEIAYVSGKYFGEAEKDKLGAAQFYDTAWAISVVKSGLFGGYGDIAGAMKKAIDAESYEYSLPDGFKSTSGIVPDDLLIDGKAYASFSLSPKMRKRDEKAAQKQFLNSYGSTTSLPAITLIYPEECDVRDVAAAIAKSWQNVLGFNVKIAAMPLAQLRLAMKEGRYEAALVPLSTTTGTAFGYVRQFADENSDVMNVRSDKIKSLVDAMESGNVAKNISGIEKAVLSYQRVIPIAQSSSGFIYNSDAKNTTFDFEQGQICLYNS